MYMLYSNLICDQKPGKWNFAVSFDSDQYPQIIQRQPTAADILSND